MLTESDTQLKHMVISHSPSTAVRHNSSVAWTVNNVRDNIERERERERNKEEERGREKKSEKERGRERNGEEERKR